MGKSFEIENEETIKLKLNSNHPHIKSVLEMIEGRKQALSQFVSDIEKDLVGFKDVFIELTMEEPPAFKMNRLKSALLIMEDKIEELGAKLDHAKHNKIKNIDKLKRKHAKAITQYYQLQEELANIDFTKTPESYFILQIQDDDVERFEKEMQHHYHLGQLNIINDKPYREIVIPYNLDLEYTNKMEMMLFRLAQHHEIKNELEWVNNYGSLLSLLGFRLYDINETTVQCNADGIYILTTNDEMPVIINSDYFTKV